MSALSLSTCQAAVLALIASAQANPTRSPRFPDLVGIPVAAESYTDTTGVADAAFEAALNGSSATGLFIFVAYPDAVRVDQTTPGTARFLATVPVILCENPVSNMATGSGGLSRDPAKVVEAIWTAVCHQAQSGPQRFLISDPLEQVSESSGCRIWRTLFECPITWKPT